MQASIFDKPVVIVGGGVTGLVSAQLLTEAGAKVVVIEKLDDVGGLARSYIYDQHGEQVSSSDYLSPQRSDGFVFDCGPHRFDVTNPNVHAFVRRVLGDRVTDFPRKSEVYFKDSYYAWPIKPQNLVQLPPTAGYCQ